jgi:protein TonB
LKPKTELIKKPEIVSQVEEDIKQDSLPATEPEKMTLPGPVENPDLKEGTSPQTGGIPGKDKDGESGGSSNPNGGSEFGTDKIFEHFTLTEDAQFEGQLDNYLKKNKRYPGKAIEANVEGKVFVSFVVDEKGKVGRAKIEKGIGYGCDEEAIRVINSLPNWKPGKYKERAVKVRLRVPFVFKLRK